MTPRAMLIAEVTLADWIASGLILGAAFAATIALRRVLRSLADRKVVQQNVADLSRQILTVVIMTLALLYAMSLLEIDIGPLLGALGISSVILGLSLQPILGNFIGSVMLHGSRPIHIGDQIASNGVEGTVVEITTRAVEVLTFDGVTVHLPNLQVLEKPLTNFTADEIRRSTVMFQVSYGTELREVHKVVVSALRENPMISDIPGPEVLFVGFADSGIDVEARFWHPAERLLARWIASEVVVAIHESLREAGIEIPFPQRVIHYSGQQLPLSDEERAQASMQRGSHQAGLAVPPSRTRSERPPDASEDVDEESAKSPRRD